MDLWSHRSSSTQISLRSWLRHLSPEITGSSVNGSPVYPMKWHSTRFFNFNCVHTYALSQPFLDFILLGDVVFNFRAHFSFFHFLLLIFIWNGDRITASPSDIPPRKDMITNAGYFFGRFFIAPVVTSWPLERQLFAILTFMTPLWNYFANEKNWRSDLWSVNNFLHRFRWRFKNSGRNIATCEHLQHGSRKVNFQINFWKSQCNFLFCMRLEESKYL